MSAPFPLSIHARQAAGQPISELMHRALANPALVSLAAGFVDQETLPVEETWQAVQAVLADAVPAQAALQYGTTAGYLPLREALLARHLETDRDISHPRWSIDQVVITAGSNQLLHLLVDTLCDPQDIVLCASPTYFVFLGMLANLGIHSMGVETDDEGIIPEALDATLSRLQQEGRLRRVKALYLNSYFDNPASVTLGEARRQQVVETVLRWRRSTPLVLIEDAAYRELRYEGPDLPSLAHYDETGEAVATTGTFSKSFSPGIRIGWGLLPRWIVNPVLDQKGNIDFGTANFNQHIMRAVLERGLLDPHIERLRQNYRAKLHAMLQALRDVFGTIEGAHWRQPQGGLYVWLRLPETIDTGLTGPLFDLAVREGMLYVPGEYFYPKEGPPVERNTMRLSFGVQSKPRLREGIEALGRAVEQVLQAK